MHVASTPCLTHYASAAHRGQTAITEINVLPGYRGTCVHQNLSSEVVKFNIASFRRRSRCKYCFEAEKVVNLSTPMQP